MGLVFGGLTIPAASTLNAVARPQSLAMAGARALVPLVYGPTRLTGRVLNILKHATDSTLVLVQVLWCQQCNSVGTYLLNDQALPAGSSSTTYTGSQSSADSTLVAAFSAQSITYADTLAGYAYSVFALPVRSFTGQLQFSAAVQGRKLYDPRQDSTNGGSGSQRLATPSTWVYSDNPTLALADWLYSSVYGAGVSPVWSSVITQANLNDTNIGTPPETHRKIGVVFEASTAVPDMAEVLRAYAGCWLVPTSTGIKLVADADASTSATYAHASGQIAGLSALQLRDSGNSPTAVEIVYTDTSQTPYREASALAQVSGAGTTLPWRQSTVRMPGIQRYSQALREATERLNKLYLSDLSCTLDVFDIGVQHEVGDIVSVTHPAGLTSKLFRVGAPPVQTAPGRWQLSLSEHDPAVYSVAVATTPSYTNAGLQISNAMVPGNVAASGFFDGFESNTVAYWVNYAGSGEVSIVSISDAGSGGAALRVGNNAGDDGAWLIHADNIPFDPTALYRVKARIRRNSGTGVVYLGVAGVANDGSTLVGTDGSASYSAQHCAASYAGAPGSSWTEFTGYVRGTAATGTAGQSTDPSSPSLMHTNVRYIRPLLVLNSGSSGQMDVDFFSIERLGGAIGTLQLGAGAATDTASANTSSDTFTDSSTVNSKTVTTLSWTNSTTDTVYVEVTAAGGHTFDASGISGGTGNNWGSCSLNIYVDGSIQSVHGQSITTKIPAGTAAPAPFIMAFSYLFAVPAGKVIQTDYIVVGHKSGTGSWSIVSTDAQIRIAGVKR